jgi:peptide/nickel transport system substrate-binding protein/oligopeptide transport system substrate-binding protein
MRGFQRARWVVGSAALALIATACGGGGGGGGAPAGQATGGGTYSIEISNPQNLVPTNTNETAGAEVLDALFVALVEYDEQNRPVLSPLAESIESADNQNWTIKIKPGWKFHNGEDVTAQSFVDAWNYGALNSNGQNNAYFFGSIEGYEDVNPTDENTEDDKVPPAKAKTMSGLKVVSPTEFTVALSQPDITFKTALGYTAFYPMPKVAFQDIKAFEDAPIGNGPFKMKGKWERNRLISTEKFADYKGTAAKADGIDFKIYQALETAYNDLRAGNLDVMDSLPPSALAGARAELGERYFQSPSSGYYFIGFPTFDPKFRNVKVRQAVSMAIDRDAITKTIYQGTRTPADAFVSPVVAGYRKGTCGEFCTYDPARAKALLAEGGGLADMTLTYNADGGHKEWTEAACNQIQQNLGVKCVAVPKPSFDVLLDDLDKAKGRKQGFGPFRLGWIMDYPSMQNYLGPLYGTGGSSNYYGYSNKQFDALVKQGQQAKTEEEAIKFWQQAEDILARDFPVVPTWIAVTNVATSQKVRNVKVDAFDRVKKVDVEVVR